MSKCLIAYYSRRGNNYVEGKIINLSVGNTEVVAKKLQELTGADLYEIKTVIPYPEDYSKTTEVTQKELRNNLRPELSTILPNLVSYELIFLGYHNWWGTMPMAVFTFLESYDFTGKTIIPFCTHEGSGMGESINDIKRICKDTSVHSGFSMRGGSVGNAEDYIRKWSINQQIKLIK